MSYLHTMTDIIQRAVIDRFANVPHRPLGIGWSNDFMRAGGVLIGCEDADLPPRHFFFVDVHRLEERKKSYKNLKTFEITKTKLGHSEL